MKKTKALTLLLLASLTTASLAACGQNLTLTDDEFTLELGENPVDHTAEFVENDDLEDITFDFDDVDFLKVGDYTASATIGDKETEFTIHIADTTAPVADVASETYVAVGEPLDAKMLIGTVTELSGSVDISFADHTYEPTEETTETTTEETVEETTEESSEESDAEVVAVNGVEINSVEICYDEVGEYDNVMTITDASGNAMEADIHIIVTEAPTITGATDMYIQVGTTEIDYMSGVTAIDGAGNDLTGSVTVSTDSVDLNTAGEYFIMYSVIDENGLMSQASVRVIVAEDIATAIAEEEETSAKRVSSEEFGTATVEAVKAEEKAAAEKAAAELAAATKLEESSSSSGNNGSGSSSGSSNSGSSSSGSSSGSGSGSSSGSVSSSSDDVLYPVLWEGQRMQSRKAHAKYSLFQMGEYTVNGVRYYGYYGVPTIDNCPDLTDDIECDRALIQYIQDAGGVGSPDIKMIQTNDPETYVYFRGYPLS